jgi:hypothetical protein
VTVLLFVEGGRDHADGGVPSSVVVAVDPDEDRLAGIGSGGEVQPVDELDLQGGEEGFGHGVVEARPGPPG